MTTPGGNEQIVYPNPTIVVVEVGVGFGIADINVRVLQYVITKMKLSYNQEVISYNQEVIGCIWPHMIK